MKVEETMLIRCPNSVIWSALYPSRCAQLSAIDLRTTTRQSRHYGPLESFTRLVRGTEAHADMPGVLLRDRKSKTWWRRGEG
mmetsp:Transcript_48668/g.75989  ORF Transcript_48668/g.75989 Transcript_48668/m.75989 type:complete len:82 (-) Transcript_48668:513-758(-)